MTRPRHVWNPYTPAPDIDAWLQREVETAVREYVENGSIDIDIFDEDRWLDVEFTAGEPLDDICMRKPIASLINEEIDMFVDGYGQLSDVGRRFVTALQGALVPVMDRIQQLLKDAPSASSPAQPELPAAASEES